MDILNRVCTRFHVKKPFRLEVRSIIQYYHCVLNQIHKTMQKSSQRKGQSMPMFNEEEEEEVAHITSRQKMYDYVNLVVPYFCLKSTSSHIYEITYLIETTHCK